MARNEVSYLNLPEGVDPIDFIFRDLRLTVPESSLTPQLIARLYERTLRAIDVNLIQSKNSESDWGLQSIRGMLQHEVLYGEDTDWIKVTADVGVIEKALPKKTPYALLYLTLFPFRVPHWKQMPTREKMLSWGNATVCADLQREALIYGKNKQLYFVSATWSPEEDYLHSADPHPNRETGALHYALSSLRVEPVKWNDERIMTRIESGQWSNHFVFIGRISQHLKWSADRLEARAHQLRRTTELLDNVPICYGR